MHPPIFFDPAFVANIILGYLLTLVGVGILLLAGVWWAWNSDTSQTSPTSGAWRALCMLGWGVFTAGWVWQIVGYVRTSTVTWSP